MRKCGRRQKAGVGFLHDDDARVLAEFPSELTLADVHGEDFGGAMLEETISETASGSAEVDGGQAGDIDLKVAEGVFEFEAAATDEFVLADEGKLVVGFDGVAGFTGELAIDVDLAGEDGALGFLAAVTEAALDEGLVQAKHEKEGKG